MYKAIRRGHEDRGGEDEAEVCLGLTHTAAGPTTLQDGTALTGKDLQLGYIDAPANYQSQLENRIQLYCE